MTIKKINSSHSNKIQAWKTHEKLTDYGSFHVYNCVKITHVVVWTSLTAHQFNLLLTNLSRNDEIIQRTESNRCSATFEMGETSMITGTLHRAPPQRVSHEVLAIFFTNTAANVYACVSLSCSQSPRCFVQWNGQKSRKASQVSSQVPRYTRRKTAL